MNDIVSIEDGENKRIVIGLDSKIENNILHWNVDSILITNNLMRFANRLFASDSLVELRFN